MLLTRCRKAHTGVVYHRILAGRLRGHGHPSRHAEFGNAGHRIGAAVADITPPTTPAELAFVFAMGFGAGNLLQNSYRLSYLEVALANPDGGFPVITTGVAAAAPGLAWRKALRLNDLRNRIPLRSRPALRRCAGPTCFLAQCAADASWASHAPPSASLSVLDLEAPVSAEDPYGNLKNDFELAKQLVAANAVVHGEGARCTVAVPRGALLPRQSLE